MRRRLALSLLAAVTLLSVAFGCSRTTSPALPELRALTVEEVAARLTASDGRTFIYDNNEQERYAKSHVPGARWLEYDRVTAADLPADHGAMLIFYCASEL
jgi:hypothetical protein